MSRVRHCPLIGISGPTAVGVGQASGASVRRIVHSVVVVSRGPLSRGVLDPPPGLGGLDFEGELQQESFAAPASRDQNPDR